MKRYCFDTSGVSNPLETMPEDIHASMWSKMEAILTSGDVAVTTEIYDEMKVIYGTVGDCIRANKDNLVLEVQNGSWDWASYLAHIDRMQTAYKQFISELNGNRKSTIGMNDLSIIALAKTLKLPLVSMESRQVQSSLYKRRIPNICDDEGVKHYTFSEFLRQEKIKL